MKYRLVHLLSTALGAIVLATSACGSEAPSSSFVEGRDPTNPDTTQPGSFPPANRGGCKNLECKQVDCGPGAVTSVSGVVTAPNGTLPLYNVIVYIPNAPLEPLADGASCDRCGSVSGEPLVSTITDVEGKFRLENVPAGDDIPLVIQIGKWRRQVTLPRVEECVDNPITDPNLTRLPRNRTEGDIPRIAVTTGRCDQLACLLPKLGLDASEFTPSDQDGRLHLYRGAAHPAGAPIPAPAPAGTRDAEQLWSDTASLMRYDMVLLSCECDEHEETKPPAAKEALYEYAARGGRVFASHFHYTWAETGPLATTAEWMGSPTNPENQPGPYFVDTSFAKGEAFAQWLVNVGASSKLGEIPISQPRENVGAVVAPTQRWVYRKTPNPAIPEATKYLTVNTPVGEPIAEQCGKFVFADMHLYGGDVQDPATALPDDAFPTSCSTTLTPEEKALVFLFFELSSCVQDDTKPPAPPVK